MQFFGGYHRETFAQIKTHLVAKTTARSGAGAICFHGAVFQNMPEKLLILLHEIKSNE